LRNEVQPESRSRHPFDQIVDGLGRSVTDVGLVPRRDLVLPADQGATECSGLDRVVRVLKVGPELFDPLESEMRVFSAGKRQSSALPLGQYLHCNTGHFDSIADRLDV